MRVILSQSKDRRGNPHLKREIATPVCELVHNDSVVTNGYIEKGE